MAVAMARVSLPDAGAARLLPVPLSPARLRARGYNQSEQLARALGRRWGWPVVDLLVRTRDTATQTALTPVARLANVAGAFAARRDVAGSVLILVDDVFTTGATIAAAAQALAAAGATYIVGVTFGRAVIPDFT